MGASGHLRATRLLTGTVGIGDKRLHDPRAQRSGKRDLTLHPLRFSSGSEPFDFVRALLDPVFDLKVIPPRMAS